MRKGLGMFIVGMLVILVGVFTFGTAPAGAAPAVPTDFTPPVMDIIEVTPEQVAVGDTVTVRVYATDNLVGIDRIEVAFWNDRVWESYLVRPEREGTTNWYKAEMLITDNLATGKWDLQTINLWDRYDNYQPYDGARYSKFFEINDPDPDLDPPVVNSVYATVETIEDEQIVTFEVDASDDREIKSVSMDVMCIDEDLSQAISVSFAYDTTKELWVGQLTIDPYMMSGRWTMGVLTVTDTSWNKTMAFEEEWPEVYFDVNNSNNDTQAPIISDISFTPTLVKPGETVKVSVSAEDLGSGLDSVMVIVMDQDQDKYREPILLDLEYNADTNKWEGEISLPLWAIEGDYNLVIVQVEDKFGNLASAIQADFPEAKFTVDSTSAIKLNSSKNTVEAGEIFEVNADIVNVRDLIAAEVRITYDPTKLRVIDADSAMDGIQVINGGILSGATTRNLVYNGTITYNVAKQGQDAFSGSGTLATIKFEALSGGNFTTALEITDSSLISYGPVNNEDILHDTLGTEITVLGAGNIQGKVYLQGLRNHSGAKISLVGTDFFTTTDQYGNYSFSEMPGGDYTLMFEGPEAKPVYLVSEQNFGVRNGEANVVAPIILATGDINGDNAISLIDLSMLALAYDSRVEDANWNALADLNDDGKVAIMDLSLLATNWEKVGYTPEVPN